MGIKERQDRERQAVRQSILDAARDLFVSDGYRNVSIRKIAERIEYSPAAIYSYFPSKDDIFFALAEEGFRRLDAKVRSALGHDRSARRVSRLLVGLLRVLQGRSRVLRADVRRPLGSADHRAVDRVRLRPSDAGLRQRTHPALYRCRRVRCRHERRGRDAFDLGRAHRARGDRQRLSFVAWRRSGCARPRRPRTDDCRFSQWHRCLPPLSPARLIPMQQASRLLSSKQWLQMECALMTRSGSFVLLLAALVGLSASTSPAARTARQPRLIPSRALLRQRRSSTWLSCELRLARWNRRSKFRAPWPHGRVSASSRSSPDVSSACSSTLAIASAKGRSWPRSIVVRPTRKLDAARRQRSAVAQAALESAEAALANAVHRARARENPVRGRRYSATTARRGSNGPSLRGRAARPRQSEPRPGRSDGSSRS